MTKLFSKCFLKIWLQIFTQNWYLILDLKLWHQKLTLLWRLSEGRYKNIIKQYENETEGGVAPQWAYLDHHVDKKILWPNFFHLFFLLQNTFKYVKINVIIHSKRKKPRMTIAKPIIWLRTSICLKKAISWAIF